jgi:hypothetical protein
MSFWGMSNSGKIAEGFPMEAGNWDWAQYKEWLDRAKNFGYTGDYGTNQAKDYYGYQAQEGMPSIEQIQSAGGQIMDVDPVIASAKARADSLLTQFGELTPASQTGNALAEQQAGAGQDIQGTSNLINQDIMDTAGNMMSRVDERRGDITDFLASASAGTQQGVNDTYGYLRGQNAATVNDLVKQAQDFYQQNYSELEKTRPGGEFAAATAARSFAPMMAQAQQALRRSGVNPLSPEAGAATARVSEAKARAMDDSMAGAQQQYYQNLTGLNQNQRQALEGLRTGGLQREIGLGQDQSGIVTGLNKDLSTAVAGQKESALSDYQTIDQRRQDLNIANQNNTLANTLDWRQGNQGTAIKQRGMEREDFTTKAGLTNAQTDADLLGLDLKSGAYQQGLGYTTQDQATKDAAMAKILGISTQDYQNMFRSADTASGYGNAALQAMLAQYGIEAPEAGWGTKMLAGGGMDLLKSLYGM